MSYGGLPPRRIDQRSGLDTSRAGVGPAPSSPIVIARVVIIGGGGTAVTGLFQYSGVPGPGNPPVAWSVPPSVTSDPYGNPLPLSGGFVAKSTSPANLVAQIASGHLELMSFNPSTEIIGPGFVLLRDAVTAGAQPETIISSPGTSAGGEAAIALLGESANSAAPAQIVAAPSSLPAPGSALFYEIQGTSVVQQEHAWAPGAVGVTVEAQHAFAGANAWAQAAGNTTWGYQLMADGTVEIVGGITVPAGFAVGQSMAAAIAAAYRPAHNQRIAAVDTNNGNLISAVLNTAGVLVFEGPAASVAAADELSIIPARVNLTA